MRAYFTVKPVSNVIYVNNRASEPWDTGLRRESELVNFPAFSIKASFVMRRNRLDAKAGLRYRTRGAATILITLPRQWPNADRAARSPKMIG